MEKIKLLDLSWHLRWHPKTKSYYAKATQTYYNEVGKRKQRSVYLHIVIMGSDFSKGEYVDHIYHDTLNNLEENMRILNNSQNSKNRNKPNSNGTTGERNVTWSEKDQKYIVQFYIEGKNIRVGYYEKEDKQKAIDKARSMRDEVYKI